jgi:PAS domain S-box-containing protein
MAELSLNECRDAVLDSIADGVFTVDRDWRIMSFNKAAERITGVPRREAIGRQCWQVFRSNICEGGCALRETLRTGQNITNKAIYVLNVDGERIPVSISTAILKDRDGHVIGGVETFRDLSTVEELRKELAEKYSLMDIIGRSKTMRELFDLIQQVAGSDSTVLIEGASGTGKELFARAIHNLSPRQSQRFVAINCGALPDSLLESELFGYKAGAFTDARRDHPGRFALAEGGTIFLDEIGNISPAMQASLLRVLQERVYEPLGGVQPVKANVRIITATNRHLADLVAENSFRQDLYYRVNVVRLQLPSLRDRREDIPLLINHFIARFNHVQGKDIAGVSDEALRVLMEHDYPGNVRELENIIEHAFVLCRGGIIERGHLPPELRGPATGAPPRQRAGATLCEFEAMHILDAVRRHSGNRTAAAQELGIDPSTLFRKVKALGIELPAKDGRNKA